MKSSLAVLDIWYEFWHQHHDLGPFESRILVQARFDLFL